MSSNTRTKAASAGAATLRDTAELLGRLLLALLFLVAGAGKMAAYPATVDYMAANGVPGVLLPLVILAEVGGAIAIIAGWKTRIVSILLAGFTILAALLFHHDFADQVQMLMFLKDFSIAGAFLILAAHGAGRLSLDARAAA